MHLPFLESFASYSDISWRRRSLRPTWPSAGRSSRPDCPAKKLCHSIWKFTIAGIKKNRYDGGVGGSGGGRFRSTGSRADLKRHSEDKGGEIHVVAPGGAVGQQLGGKHLWNGLVNLREGGSATCPQVAIPVPMGRTVATTASWGSERTAAQPKENKGGHDKVGNQSRPTSSAERRGGRGTLGPGAGPRRRRNGAPRCPSGRGAGSARAELRQRDVKELCNAPLLWGHAATHRIRKQITVQNPRAFQIWMLRMRGD